jgi:glycerophosphoryl diester phosphodiesterase
MTLPIWIENSYLRVMDSVFERWPQPMPCADALAQCRLIAHRGIYDNVTVLENTLPAFEQAAAAGVWGIELDIRWSSDRVPVVFHDGDLRRLHDSSSSVEQLSDRTIRRLFPAIPRLSEVVERFGRRLHLMLEIKANAWPDAIAQMRGLREVLTDMVPSEHFHFLALDPRILARISGFPPRSFLSIAYHWPDAVSRTVIGKQWGGLCAHYSLMRRALIARHKACGQKVGTAYPASRNCLFREINRGVDYIFSNNAGELQAILKEARAAVFDRTCASGR